MKFGPIVAVDGCHPLRLLPGTELNTQDDQESPTPGLYSYLWYGKEGQVNITHLE